MEFKTYLKIIFLGLNHLFIDTIPAYILVISYSEKLISLANLAFLLSIYIFLAFGAQFFFGYIADLIHNPKAVIMAGLVLAILGLVISRPLILVAIIIVGIANSLVHVGGGIVALKTDPGKATLPGIFVAFGALGLYEGTSFGKTATNITIYLIITALVLIFFLSLMKLPDLDYKKKLAGSNNYLLPLLLIFAVIFFRGYLGYIIKFPHVQAWLPIAAVLAGFLGKLTGGLLADRFGWLKTTIFSLLAVVPLYFLGVNYLVFGLLALFLFQITMPVTLTFFGNLFPQNPGFAFGLTCLALYFGYLISQVNIEKVFNPYLVVIGILLSSIFIFIGINRFFELKYKHDYRP